MSLPQTKLSPQAREDVQMLDIFQLLSSREVIGILSERCNFLMHNINLKNVVKLKMPRFYKMICHTHKNREKQAANHKPVY